MSNNIVVGVDIGGTHITAALIDLLAHSIIDGTLVRHPVDSHGTSEQIIKEWAAAIVDCRKSNHEISAKIGIAMPGPFDYEKGISLIKDLDKFESLYNLNVKELLANELKIKEENIYMMNDANCFIKGEVFAGAARDCNTVIGITLGTGLGSAIFKNGIIEEGKLYCAPYKEGTCEDYLSARWFIKRYKELTGITVSNVKEIKERIPDEKNATFLFKEFGYNLGKVLVPFIKSHHAETIVIGGNVIKAWEFFINETQEVLISNSINVTLVKSELGEMASLIGAGSLCR